MSLSSVVDRSGPFLLTGLPQTIGIGFPFQQSSDLVVLDLGATGSPRDPADVLTLGSDYTVTGGGYDGGNNMQTGSIVVVSGGAGAVLVNDRIMILRGVPINQPTSLISTGPLTIALVEQVADRLATLIQQVNEITGRSLQFENFELLSPTLSKSGRINKFLAFDANGNISFSDGTDGSSGGTVTSVGSGNGLTGGPITGAGSLSQDFTYSGIYTGANVFQAITGIIPLSVLGINSHQSLLVTAGAGAGISFGVQIIAGTNASDYGLSVLNAGAFSMFKVDGAGQIKIPLFYSTLGVLQTDGSGNVTTGPIEGVAIGQTTPAAGGFTTLATTGNTSVGAGGTTGNQTLYVNGGSDASSATGPAISLRNGTSPILNLGTPTSIGLSGSNNTDGAINATSASSGTIGIYSKNVLAAQITGTGVSVAGKFGVNGVGEIAKPTVTGSRGSNAALTSLLTALASYGLITDSTS